MRRRRASRSAARRLKAAGSGRMCATGGGPPGAPARRSRSGAQRAAGRAAATSRPEAVDERQGGRCRAGGSTGTSSTRSSGPPTSASSRSRVGEQERPQERADDGAEAQPGLGHRRLLVPEQHRVERAGQRAESRPARRAPAAGRAGGPPRGRRSRRAGPRRQGRGRRGRPRARGRARGRGQAAGAGPGGSGSGRCRRKVPVARLTSTAVGVAHRRLAVGHLLGHPGHLAAQRVACRPSWPGACTRSSSRACPGCGPCPGGRR